ncbi:flagellar hook-length control protein FliK [Thalassobacillus hwangdonensis]|uniref:Flagellar hook-length control protein FliK n=1 Tax=Thalassobacillus hwangdonensis TaxID=546108 RepID=A0ABW3KWX0_9BACI
MTSTVSLFTTPVTRHSLPGANKTSEVSTQTFARLLTGMNDQPLAKGPVQTDVPFQPDHEILEELRSLFAQMHEEGIDLLQLIEAEGTLQSQMDQLSPMLKDQVIGMWHLSKGLMPVNEPQDNQVELLSSLLGELSSTADVRKPNATVSLFAPESMVRSNSITSANLLQLQEQFRRLENIVQQMNGFATKAGAEWQSLSKKLLQSLTEMQQMIKHMNPESNQKIELTAPKDMKFSPVVKELLERFQQRQQILSTASGYKQQAQVTSRDLSNWMKQALDQYESVEAGNKTLSTLQTGTAITKVEQYVIHLNQSQTKESAQQQLIQQFERVLKSSKFLHNRNGGLELQMRLKPGNLGDVIVKMTQLNGEMAVKIMVSSQAAKEMLDGNMQQLRHMFSPQQVVIEKVEQNNNGQALHSNQQEKSSSGNDQGSSNNEHQQSDKQNKEEDSTTFMDYLLNEEA